MSESAIKINAIVVKSSQSGENDRVLTLLSPEMGQLTVMAKGVRSLRHKSRSSVMPLSYSSFVLKKIKDGFYSLTSADLIESFRELSENVELLSYGAYFASLCRMCIQSGTEASEEVRLLLNTLYVLCRREDAAPLIKVVFELKLMELCGIMPEFSPECPCGEKGRYFSVTDGEIRCTIHREQDSIPISPSELALALYISQTTLKDALYHSCDISAAHSLSRLTEPFLRYHLGTLPESLDYLRKITKKSQ